MSDNIQSDTASISGDDHAWVIDSLVQFLSGPVWNKPIAAFIEKKSTIFEPDTEEFIPDHHTVHKEYRNLVDSLLGGFVEELQISPIQFQQAVNKGHHGQSMTFARFQPGALLEQVWAASDFTAFSQLMGLRNLELQLQALDSIRNRGNMPYALKLLDDDAATGEIGGEERLLKHVLRRSMEESSIIERVKKINNLSLAENVHVSKSTTTLEQTSEISNKEMDDEVQNQTNTKSPNGNNTDTDINVKSEQLTTEEIQKRKDYLCSQRDKLLKAKGRLKYTTHEVEETAQTSQQAQLFSAESSEYQTHNSQVARASEQQAIKLRKALVNRLKAEVINKP